MAERNEGWNVPIEERGHQNIGSFDRMIRSGIGGALMGAVLARPGPLDIYQAVIVLIAAYPLLTALIGWDLFYALVEEVRTRPSPPSEKVSMLRRLWWTIYTLGLPVYKLLVWDEGNQALKQRLRKENGAVHSDRLAFSIIPQRTRQEAETRGEAVAHRRKLRSFDRGTGSRPGRPPQ